MSQFELDDDDYKPVKRKQPKRYGCLIAIVWLLMLPAMFLATGTRADTIRGDTNGIQWILFLFCGAYAITAIMKASDD